MQDDNDIVLSVKNVSKCFEMYEKPVHRLYQTLCAGKKKFYKEFWALKDISFDVHRGECVGIIGRNGAGKSTLLQIITGTLTPTSGEVKVKGRVAALLELGSGFNPEFTGRENVYLNGSILGLSKDEIDKRYDDILAFADIGDFINQPVKTYSSGMMVRLAFAVIAHVDADVMIIDEALAVGDVLFQQKCMRFMRKFIKEHTVFLVSHDTAAITSLCDKAILLDKGCLKVMSSAKEVVERYLREIYSAQQNVDFFASNGSHKSDDYSLPVDKKEPTDMYFDMRTKYINASNLRNDLEVFKFEKTVDSFGDGGVSVERVYICDDGMNPLSWVVGGEMVRLVIQSRASKALFSPIVGFLFRDRLGQNLFGDNTFLVYRDSPLSVPSGGVFRAMFEFQMPYIPAGDYSVCVAVAEGTQENHIQHQWINEALVVKSQSTYPNAGLVGIPMRDIKLQVL